MTKYEELLNLIKLSGTSKESINFLLNYYQNSLGWNKEDAVDYTIKLFKDGVIDEIKVLGGKNHDRK